ncbi:MAG: zf-HC2 domain-containing protein [Planctomycetaceae bacterium]|nr:zf-HC2 domain-containing protein [Planctomycetaceae bacterium]
MTMNCSEAKHLIHLDVGDDLRSEEKQQLATHLEACSDCRSYHAGMAQAMSALLTLRNAPAVGIETAKSSSVWPALSREIKRRGMSRRVVRKFNLQVVALSVCSLSLAVVTMVQSLSALRDGRDPSEFIQAQGVSIQGPSLLFQARQQQHAEAHQDGRLTPVLPHENPTFMPQSF